MIPSPHEIYLGDGLSGFSGVVILDYTTPEIVYFAPVSEGWAQYFLTYSLPLEVFNRVYQKCESPPPASYSSKTASPSPRPSFFPRLKSFLANLMKTAGL